MSIARVIVCERRGTWAAELRRYFGDGTPLRALETRSAAGCFAELQKSPASAVIWELGVAAFDILCDALLRQRNEFPASCTLVAGTRRDAAKEWILREAGAVHAVFSPRELAAAAQIALRHLSRVTEPSTTLEQLIQERMPWQWHASAGFRVQPTVVEETSGDDVA